ncbi:44040_t:CDS:1, partial [Gigaspora margarita]
MIYQLGIKKINSFLKQKTSIQAILISIKVNNKKHIRAETNQVAIEKTNQIVTEEFQVLELYNNMEIKEINQNLQSESSSGL